MGDSLDFGGGDDFYVSTSANDTLNGNGGNDTLFGVDGADVIMGGDGNDSLHAGDGTDSLDGGAGNDTLFNPSGRSTLSGGDGNDSIFVQFIATNEIYRGGAGDDALSVDLTGVTDVAFSATVGATFVIIGNGINGPTVFDVERLAFSGGNLADTITGGAGGDTLSGGAGDILVALSGNDSIVSTLSYANLQGGDGQDKLFLNMANVVGGSNVATTLAGAVIIDAVTSFTLNGVAQGAITGFETVLVLAGQAADTLTAMPGINDATLFGGAGSDIITASAGLNDLLGDAGNDTIIGGSGFDFISHFEGADSISGGEGGDLIQHAGSFIGSRPLSPDFSESDSDGADTIDGGGGADTIGSATGADTITGGDGNDSLGPGRGNDTVRGGEGNDTIGDYSFGTDSTPGGGIDNLFGDGGNDSIASSFGDFASGGAGNDTIRTLYSGGVSATLDGGDGDDMLSASSLFNGDVLLGGAGADSITASGGDSVDAGDGDDLVTISASFSTIFGGAGADTLATGAALASVTILGFGASVNIETFAFSATRVDAISGFETLTFTDGSRTAAQLGLGAIAAGSTAIKGAAATETLDGGAGDDTVAGLAGADSLIGGDGFDLLNHVIDQASGGTAGVYVDLVNGFAQDGWGAYDLISGIEGALGSNAFRPGSAQLSDLMIGNAQANAFVTFGGQDYVAAGGGNDTVSLGLGVDDIGLGEAGDDVIYGGGGADFIYGGDGSDRVTGDDGNDWLFGGGFDTASPTAGIDTLSGGAGTDVIAVGSSGGAASMSGGAGNDTLYGGSGVPGNDTISPGSGSDYLFGAGGADAYRFETTDIVASDFDQLFGFKAGDTLVFAASLNGTIFGVQTTINDISGAYLGSTANTWALWMPYTDWSVVQTQIAYI